MYLLLMNLMIILISGMLLFLNFNLSKKMNKERSKLVSFECGFDNMSMLRLPFSLHFYMISIIFLIFDVEISLIFPVIKSLNLMLVKNSDVFMVILIILIYGLYYEWWEGSLSWLI
uniref:NADH-ubiquinone oxidoreductase chain 3 n=1 Tax=Pujadella villari TaxID=2943468 RepID=A0A9E8G6S5_9HYME|nr:NADH dehydrogenase subunit 3 [Pujadella villari]